MNLRVGFLVFLLAILGAVSAMLVLPLLQYVMAAALLAFVLHPLHERLANRTIGVRGVRYTVHPRVSAGLLTALGIVAAVLPVVFLSIILLQTVLSFIEDLGEMDLVETAREIAIEFGIEPELLDELEASLLTEINEMLDMGLEVVLQEVLGLLNTSIRVGIGLLVLVFLLYYFLVDGRRLVRWIGTVAPLEDGVRRKLFGEINVVTWAVMKSHVLVALAEGILGGIGLYLVGVPNVAFWTVIMIVVSFLPAIGVWLVWGPAVGYLLLVGEPVNAVLLLLYGIAVLSVVDNYLRAILVDRSSGVHPAVVLVGVIGGIYLFGILGLFLGPVLLAVFKAALEVFGEVYHPEEGEKRTRSVSGE